MASRTSDVLDLLAVSGEQSTNDISESLGLSEPEDLRLLSALLYNLAQRELVSNEGGEGMNRRWKLTKAGRVWVNAPVQVATPAAPKKVKVDQVVTRPAHAARKAARVPAPTARANGTGPVIERGIPIPGRVFRSRYTAVLAEMQPTDSVLLDNQHEASHFMRLMRKQGMQRAQRRQADGTVRVWRTA